MGNWFGFLVYFDRAYREEFNEANFATMHLQKLVKICKKN